MKKTNTPYLKEFKRISLLFIILLILSGPAFSYPVRFIDSSGNEIVIKDKPVRVISIVPSVTEIIFKIDAGNSLAAITYHTSYPAEASNKEIIGGFFSPSLDKIEKLEPDILFVSSLHKEVIKEFSGKGCTLINLETGSIADSYKNILLLGRIFGKEEAAAGIVEENKRQISLIAKKVAKIPVEKRKRVIRLMGREKVMTPGADSFQNELIRAAGGIAPDFVKNGKIVSVSKEEWIKFNPQVIYGCGGDKKTASDFFSQPGWKDVDAVRNRSIFYFPCALTCRASTNTGHFISWLSARMYLDYFSKKENLVLDEHVFETRPVELGLDYIKNARIDLSYIQDFINKTLVVDFKAPMTIVSTLEGQRTGLETIGNHYFPPPGWYLGHDAGLAGLRARIYKVLNKNKEKTSFLFTGADMDNLSISRKKFKQLEVVALVTAGVKGNAVRMSKDIGGFYEPGTINIILLTNTRLTPRAMIRAIISATEAKTAALADMDIRSTYSPGYNQATGTGTDNIMVVEGRGFPIDSTGGHTKMGELIAKAVYNGVKAAISMQNSLVPERSVFQRLRDRNISPRELVSDEGCECGIGKNEIVSDLESILIEPRYASFIKSSFSISDDVENGLFPLPAMYRDNCRRVAEEIAGKEIDEMEDLIDMDNIPPVIEMALNALLNGIYGGKR